MQPTTRFHDSIPNAILQEADGGLHDPVAFHPTNGMFYPHANGRNLPIRRLLRRCEFLTTRFFLGLNDRNARQAESLEALILIQTTAGGQGIPGELRDALLRCFAVSVHVVAPRYTGSAVIRSRTMPAHEPRASLTTRPVGGPPSGGAGRYPRP